MIFYSLGNDYYFSFDKRELSVWEGHLFETEISERFKPHYLRSNCPMKGYVCIVYDDDETGTTIHLNPKNLKISLPIKDKKSLIEKGILSVFHPNGKGVIRLICSRPT